MNFLKKYEKEKKKGLSKADKRALLYLPYLFIQWGLHKLFNIFPALNLRYREILRKMDGRSDNDDIFSTPHSYTLTEDIEKVNPNLPHSLKYATLFRKWSFYRKYTQNNEKRDVIYITRDSFKKGDTYIGHRLDDHLIYKKGTSKENLPVFILIATYNDNDRNEIKEMIDIAIGYLEDDYLINKVNISVDKNKKNIYIYVKFDELTHIDEKLLSNVDNMGEKITQMVKNYWDRKVEYTSRYSIKGSKDDIDLYYTNPEFMKWYFKNIDKYAYDSGKYLHLGYPNNYSFYIDSEFITHLLTDRENISTSRYSHQKYGGELYTKGFTLIFNINKK